MVFLRPGPTLDSEDLARVSGKLRQLASLEFASIYHENKDRFDPVHLFGDEVEYLIVINDHLNRKVRVLPIYPHLSRFLSDLSNNSTPASGNKDDDELNISKSILTPEYGSFMVESIPDEPYSLDSNYPPQVTKSLWVRRKRLERILDLMGYKDARVTTLTNFLRLGCKDCAYEGDEEFRSILTKDTNGRLSKLLPDICVNAISRFFQITTNISSRRGGTRIFVPTYHHITNTSSTYHKAADGNGSSEKDDANMTLKGLETNHLLTQAAHSDIPLFTLLSQEQLELAQLLSSLEVSPDTNNSPNSVTAEDELFKYILNQVYSNDPLLVSANASADLDTNYSNSISMDDSTSNSLNSTINHYNNPNTLMPNNATNSSNDYIFMDTVGFGMGMCCLQLTFSCKNLEEARYLYDQFVVLTPIFLSLSAATVGYRGQLAGIDTRWPVLVQAMDDLSHDRPIVKKPRYSTSSLFLSDSQFCKDNYKLLNDITVACDSDSFRHLLALGIDPILARYVSHNFVYQPLVVYEEDLGKVNCSETDAHYQIFHATSWNSVRFNHPKFSNYLNFPSNPNTISNTSGAEGNNATTTATTRTSKERLLKRKEWASMKLPWRVEFRPMELQLTDRENAMFISTVAYLVKVLLKRRLNLYMPLSLVDLNTDLASKLESCHGELFHFREDVHADELSLGRFTLHDILFGKVGLFKTVRAELDLELREGKVDSEFHATLSGYLAHFELLTRGVEPTNATRVRRYVQSHPEYQGDGHIPEGVLYDMVNELTCK